MGQKNMIHIEAFLLSNSLSLVNLFAVKHTEFAKNSTFIDQAPYGLMS